MSTDPSVNAALYHSRSGGRKLGSALLESCKAWGAVMPSDDGLLASLVPLATADSCKHSMTRDLKSRVSSHHDDLSIV